MSLLAVAPIVPVVGVLVTAAVVGVYGYFSGWWNSRNDYREDEADNGDRGEPPGPGPSPLITGYVCSRSGKSADADRYHSPEPVIEDLRMLGFDLDNMPYNIESAKSRAEIMRAQRRFRELELAGMAGAPNSFIDGIMGGCTLLALADAMEMHGAGTWSEEEE